MPSWSVKVQQDDLKAEFQEVQEEPQDEEPEDDEVHEEVPDQLMEGVCSQEGEETQEQTRHSEETENLICLQHVLLWSAMAIPQCLNF